MALPCQTILHKRKRSQAVAIDIGSHTTKAVCIQRKGDGFELLRYAVQEAPPRDKPVSSEMLSSH